MYIKQVRITIPKVNKIQVFFHMQLIFILFLKVIIQGFKSYREQTVVEPFDKGHNVVGKLTFILDLKVKIFMLDSNYIYLNY